FSLEDALKLVVKRGKLMERVPSGVMLIVPVSEHEIAPFLGIDVSLAAINAPTSCVISGTAAAVEQIETRLQQISIDCRRLRFSHASHSPMMDPILDQFTEAASRARPKPPRIPLISNVTGTWIEAAQATDPGYWATHL